MPFGIPSEDFDGGFGLPRQDERTFHVTESAYRPENTEVIGLELIGDCPRCGRHVTKTACNYCPRCGCKLDWE